MHLKNFSVLAERDISVNSKIIARLQSHRFPDYKWDKLAVGLSLAEEIESINASTYGSNTAKLNHVIKKWTDEQAGKPENQLWVVLVKAVKESEEKRVALKLSEELKDKDGILYQPSSEDDDDD